MKKFTAILTLLFPIVLLTASCSREGWTVDYGTPEAQFHEDDLASKGEAFLKKKVTVKGTVAKVETSDPDEAWVQLSQGTRCNLGHLRVMAESLEIGEEVYINGILKRNEEGKFILDPAIKGDPKMKFTPVE